ncbi:Sphingosine-1-phosphate lyase, partial [Trichostrongylus colubriformis]
MEAEVVHMCCTLMHADAEGCGTMSTGGTTSILLACLSHRNRALKRGILFPEMVIPTSAHAAFTKAAEVFRIRAVRVPVDPFTFKVDLRKMKAAITSRTCMLVGSAPNFPFGTVDDIVGIGQLGQKYDIPVHVDACLGGFILPFIDDHHPFDFRVPGVCSISADTHKYGLSPKGSSVILYKNKDYLHNQYFCDADWQGGIYASSTLEGSRAGLNIALCWASLLYQGFSKYKQHATAVVATTKKIRDGIRSIPELRLQGSSDVCIVSWTSDTIDIHRLYDLIGKKGWQLTNLQFPSG